MTNNKFFIYVLCAFICISLLLNGVLVYLLIRDSKIYQLQQSKTNISDFKNTFEEKVLLADEPVDFDTRLSLETAVRSLNDREILAQWQNFTNSKTEKDATVQAKALLKLLIQKTAN